MMHKPYPLCLGPAEFDLHKTRWRLEELHTKDERTYYSVRDLKKSYRDIVSLPSEEANRISTKDLYLTLVERARRGIVEW